MILSYEYKKLKMRIEKIEIRIKKLYELNAPKDLIEREKDWLEYNNRLLKELE